MVVTSSCDIEASFCESTVSEIRDAERKLKIECEQKKEDLRQMVGRRYRDILEAADNIQQMKLTADQVLENLRNVGVCFEGLHSLQTEMISKHYYLSSTKRSALTDAEDPKLQRKIFLLITELICDCLYREDILDTALCLLLADRLYHCLDLQPLDSKSKQHINSVWDRVKRLKIELEKSRAQKLSECVLSTNVSLDCLASFVLLDQYANVNTCILLALSKFLDLRKNAILVAWKSSGINMNEICDGIRLAFQTLMIVDKTFIKLPDGKSSLIEKVSNASLSSGAIAQLDFWHKKAAMSKFVNEGSVARAKTFVDLEASDLATVCNEWCAWFSTELHLHITTVLQFCDSLESINLLKSTSLDLLSRVQISETSLENMVSGWQTVLCDSLNDRAEKVTISCLHDAAEHISQEFSRALKSGDCAVEKSKDFASFLWSDLPTDSGTSVYVGKSAPSPSSLQLKAKGISRNIYLHCQKFCKEVENIQNLLVNYTQGLSVDSARISGCFSTSCQDSIQTLAQNFQKSIVEFSSIRDTNASDNWHSEISKFCLCLCDMLPSVVKRRAESDHKLSATSDDLFQVKVPVIDSIKECANDSLRLWAVSVVSRASVLLKDSPSVFDHESKLVGIQTWDCVEIDEETEDGSMLKSRFEMPTQCSFGTSNFLFSVCMEANYYGGHAIPQKALHILLSEILKAYWKHCSGVISKWKAIDANIPQRIAIQLLFDLRVLQHLLVWKPATELEKQQLAELSTASKLVLQDLEVCIDPFDYEVLAAPLKQNINKYVLRTCTMFGHILAQSNQSLVSRLSVVRKNEGERISLPVAVARNERFCMLPSIDHTKTSKSYSSSAMPTISTQWHNSRTAQAPSLTSSLMQKSSSFYDRISNTWFGGN